jgi:ABC-type uncharacterized transport system substrate-binding protein
MIVPYNVTFVGDFFSTTVTVELDTDEPDLIGASAEELEDTASDLANNILEFHYGWNVGERSTSIEVVAG